MQRNVPPVPVQLDSSTAIKLNLGGSVFQERNLMGRSDVWHKVKIIRGAQYDREATLQAILDAIEPADLIPIKYQIIGEDATFLVRNCGPALDKLCKCNLIVKQPHGDPLILVITLGYALISDLKINIQPLLLTALGKRYNQDKKLLNLQAFHKDPVIAKTAYCPLSRLRTFSHVLKLANKSVGTIQHLDIRHNDLFNLTAIESSELKSIKYLDLRHNNLINIDALGPLKTLTVSRLWLDGNPVCENYATAIRYIESVKKYCTHLTQLDGVYIANTSGMPMTCESYFKNGLRCRLIEQFVSHFFNLYDSNDRTVLRGLYHKNAFYSMSFAIPLGVAQRKNILQYTTNRNILKTSDSKKRQLHLYYGPENILVGLKKLPRSYHDKNTFMYDLIHDDGRYIAISVSGVFKKLNSTPHVLSFNRTFVLLAGEDNEYNILNDQYHIDAAPEGITSESIVVRTPYEEFVPTYFSATEKGELLIQFGDITTLNDEWCKTYLDESNWDIRKAIANFMKDYESSSIPGDAFMR